MRRKRLIIMGAAGRDFHNFNVCYRGDPRVRVVAFTAAQIPFIADRRYPPSLAGPLYPKGIPIYPEERLEDLISRYRVDQVVFSYSDVSHQQIMHLASRVLACGADFHLLGPHATMLRSRKIVIAVSAVRTGCGKSEVSRYLCDIFREVGINPVVVRHPMPYGDLEREEVERFASFDDLTLHGCTIEEREEFEPLLAHGAVVFAGVDYARILRAAEKEGDVIIWDGGNNDFPFFRPELEITIVDPLRPGDETGYFPGEVNLRRAQVVIINKANAVSEEVTRSLELSVRAVNPTAQIVRTSSVISLVNADPAAIAGKTVLVVEDGPSVTHGSRPSGAGIAAALQFGAAQMVDPRPYAVGSIRAIFDAYPHVGPLLPAMGYSKQQVEELRCTMASVPCDMVLSATPIDLSRIMALPRPTVRVTYDISEEVDAPLRTRVLATLVR